MYRELRVYTVNPGAMEAWVAEWREHIYPLVEPEPTRHLAATEHWPLRSIV